MRYSKHLSTKTTPQNQPVPGKNMVPNNAGGYGFVVDNWNRLERFLILGTEKGTYYVGEQKLTQENASSVLALLKGKDSLKVVEKVVEISTAGRAPKNDAAVFVLAMAACLAKSEETRKAALEALPKVCRIPTHLFQFVDACNELRGWGRSLKTAVANWYLNNNSLALHAVKYPSRGGWSHKDLLRLSHPKTEDAVKNDIFKFITKGTVGTVTPKVIIASELLKTQDRVSGVETIRLHNLPWEVVPNEWFDHPDTWEALLHSMGITALLRNLNKMTKVGLLTAGSVWTKFVVDQLTNQELLTKGRVHPMNVFLASTTYAQGHGLRGSLTWTPVSKIVDALEDTFEKCFPNVSSIDKPMVVALDCSGSMAARVNGAPVSCAQAAAAMAIIFARTEKDATFCRFDTKYHALNITKRTTIDSLTQTLRTGGGTDVGQAVKFAEDQSIIGDILIFTDNETWAGGEHVFQRMNKYRNKFNSSAKLVLAAMAATDSTVGDEEDVRSLDVCGLDSAVPQIVSDFLR
jgi:60 kDa SS-A/Ro ribonucleoprotein